MPLALLRPNNSYNRSHAACRSNEFRGHAKNCLVLERTCIGGCPQVPDSPIKATVYAGPPSSPAGRC